MRTFSVCSARLHLTWITHSLHPSIHPSNNRMSIKQSNVSTDRALKVCWEGWKTPAALTASFKDTGGSINPNVILTSGWTNRGSSFVCVAPHSYGGKRGKRLALPPLQSHLYGFSWQGLVPRLCRSTSTRTQKRRLSDCVGYPGLALVGKESGQFIKQSLPPFHARASACHPYDFACNLPVTAISLIRHCVIFNKSTVLGESHLYV